MEQQNLSRLRRTSELKPAKQIKLYPNHANESKELPAGAATHFCLPFPPGCVMVFDNNAAGAAGRRRQLPLQKNANNKEMTSCFFNSSE
jgi:hypothetical protein